MGITANTKGAFDALESAERRIESALVDYLASIGERLCDVARATKTYDDVTGNLTDSIGYGVVRDGVVVRYGGFGGGVGGSKGLDALQRATSESGSGTSLVCVAGMKYATYVERRGYAVLDGARVQVDSIVKSLKERLSL